MPASKINLKIEQGATFDYPLAWQDETGTPINLTGYTARMQIRSDIRSDVVLLSLTTENGMIELTPLEGKIRILIPASITEDITWNSGVYDLELVLPGTPSPDNDYVYRFLQGNVSVLLEVTR